MRLFSVLLALCLAGCAPRLAGVSAPIGLSASQIDAVKRDVRSTLKDPQSAMFGRIIGGPTADGSFSVCGLVNAKNSFGGYVGDQPFYGTLNASNQFTVTLLAHEAITQNAVRQACSKAGLSL